MAHKHPSILHKQIAKYEMICKSAHGATHVHRDSPELLLGSVVMLNKKKKYKLLYFLLHLFLGVLRVNVFSRLFIYLDYLSVRVEFKLCIFCCHALMQKLTPPL